MREEYKKELADLKAKMIAAEAFAEKLPIFAKQILERKLTEKDSRIVFGNNYKNLHLAWGINRSFCEPDNRPINYKGKWDGGFLFNVYVNSFSLFDESDDFGLWEFTKHLDVFHRDYSNSTFYVTDENIEPLLETLNEWVAQAFEKLKIKRATARLEKARKEIEALEAAVSKAGGVK